MSDTENNGGVEEAKKKIKRKMDPKIKKEEEGDVRVNPKYNISEIGNKARRKELYAKLKKEKKKVSSKFP